MDNPTRRLDRSELPQGQPEETHRLDTSGSSTSLCLRCGQHMIETSAYTQNQGGGDGSVLVGIRGIDPDIWHGWRDTVSCDSLTCLNCGYTELQVADLQRLNALYAKALGIRAAETSTQRINRLYAEEQRRLKEKK